jgi:phage-related minor tail protein
MASQYLARLGIVLGVDSGELVQGIEDAKKQFHTFRTQVEKDTKAAAREFEILKNATEDYGKTLTKVEQIQREIERGRFQFASQNVKDKLLEQAKAYDAQAASMKKVTGVMTEQQKLQVGYQLTDFFTQVASGQNAMIAFIQQGGQLKDTMGGVGNAIKAITSVFTPLRIAIGGVVGVFGALGYAFYSGMKEADDFNDSLTLTNRYAGITYDQFNTLSKQLSGDTNKSIGTVRESLMAVVASGQFTEKSIGAVTNAITTYASIAGISGKEAANKLMSAFDGTAAGVKRLNNEMNFLTLAQYKQIEALERANKKQEAAELGALAMNKMLETQRRQLGYLEKSWENVKKAASSFWDWLKGIGRPEEAGKAIENIKNEIFALEQALSKSVGTSGADKKYREALKAQIDAKKAQVETMLETERFLARSQTGVAGEKDAINLYDKAGGLQSRMKLAEEAVKLETDAKFKARMASATEEMQIEIELEQKIAQAKNEESKKNQETFNQFTVEAARIRAAKVAEAEAEAEKKRVEWRKKEQQKAFQADAAAFDKETEVKFRLIDERNKIFADAETKLESQRFAKEELDAKFSLIGATQKELDIAKARIEAQKELNQLMRSKEFAGMTSEDQEKAKQVYEQTLQAKIANIELAESLQRVQGMYDAVWSNMSSAIENFVRTGKLSIKDFTKSVIQDMLIMNMKLQAMTLIRGLLGSFMAGFNTGSVGNAATMAPGGGYFADGGDPPVGKVSVVGERGPELFVPRTAGTIVPNHALAGMGSTTNVTNNYINAIDAKSFEQRLLESNQAIWSANQYATKNMSTNFGRT